MIVRLLSLAADLLLAAIAPPSCAACDARVTHDVVFCTACAATIERAREGPVAATYEFGGALADAIRRMKYASRSDLARPLASLVEVPEHPPAPDVVVVPVPSHPARVRSRGFDPVAGGGRPHARRREGRRALANHPRPPATGRVY
ncbi:MAG: hypothetical protein ACHREM_28510, partial [Polyangiales bacterium]